MSSQFSSLADPGSLAPALEGEVARRDEPELGAVEPTGEDASPLDGGPLVSGPLVGGPLVSGIVEELTNRLPTSELVKIIKGALECGRRNVPFTESALLRAMTFGSTTSPARRPAGAPRSPRGG